MSDSDPNNSHTWNPLAILYMEKWHGFLAVVHLLWPENRVFNQLQTCAYLFQGLEVPPFCFNHLLQKLNCAQIIHHYICFCGVGYLRIPVMQILYNISYKLHRRVVPSYYGMHGFLPGFDFEVLSNIFIVEKRIV